MPFLAPSLYGIIRRKNKVCQDKLCALLVVECRPSVYQTHQTLSTVPEFQRDQPNPYLAAVVLVFVRLGIISVSHMARVWAAKYCTSCGDMQCDGGPNITTAASPFSDRFDTVWTMEHIISRLGSAQTPFGLPTLTKV